MAAAPVCALPPGLAGAPLGVRLWLFELDEATAPEPDLLSTAERERAARFVFERDRRRYLAAHSALRRVLHPVAGLAAGAAFAVSAHGKPELQPPARGSFSLSHSGPWALVGYRETGAIGVDIEVLDPIADLPALAEQNLTGHEQRQLAACRDDAERLHAFLTVWTRKEACLKARGIGLGVAPASFETGFDAPARTVHFRTDEDVPVAAEVCSIQPGAGLVAAVARVVDTHASA